MDPKMNMMIKQNGEHHKETPYQDTSTVCIQQYRENILGAAASMATVEALFSSIGSFWSFSGLKLSVRSFAVDFNNESTKSALRCSSLSSILVDCSPT